MAAALVSLVAVGALIAWADLFLGDWPDGFGRWGPVVVIGLAIVAQPVLTWVVAYGVRRNQPDRPI
jgi:hypothetical protein